MSATAMSSLSHLENGGSNRNPCVGAPGSARTHRPHAPRSAHDESARIDDGNAGPCRSGSERLPGSDRGLHGFSQPRPTRAGASVGVAIKCCWWRPRSVTRACLLYWWVMFRQTEVHGSPVEVYAVHERAVGASRSATPLQRGPERPSVRRQSPGGRGHCLPVSDRDPVAGSPRAVRSVADSVEAAPSIRRRWHLGSRADADPCRGRRCR